MELPDPLTPGRVFCVGAAGSGVRALAELLHGFGWAVTGTDRAKPDVLARLRARGPAVTLDPAGRAWDGPAPDLLLRSPAVPDEDPAVRRAAAEGVPRATHVDVLAELTRRIETVAVAGTHGKSSTAAALVHLLRAGGRRVAGFVGAEPVDPGYSFADPAPDLLVVEACEWNRHILRLAPTHAVVTGVEFDHPDTFRDFADLNAAFAAFRSRLPRHGTLWERLDLRTGAAAAAFCAVERLPRGTTNADLAAAAAVGLGADPGLVADALPSVPALRRRFETCGAWRGRTVVDDYAHHPAGLSWAMHRAGALAPAGKRVAVVFQPHQTLRTRKLFPGFAPALAAWDAAAVLPVFPARETASENKCVKLARDLVREAGPAATFLPSLDDMPGWADDSTRPGDVLVLAGAGDVDRARDLFFPPSR